MLCFRALTLALLLFTPLSVRADHFNVYHPPVPLGSFSLKDIHGKIWTKDDLRGKYWIVHFFYCTCNQGCALTTANMAKLQAALADRADVVLVSIHVNPDEEDRDLLARYARDFGADPKRWLFLTGPEKTVFDVVQKSFFHGLEKRKEKVPGDQVAHPFKLLLIDRKNQMVGYVEDGKNPDAIKVLETRVRAMIHDEGPSPPRLLLPSINAGLNATCTVLLIVGFLAIRRRQETFHKICMLSALAVSIVFLASYLYYHFVILDGKVTRFPDSWLRPYYLGVLLSHTVLAALVAPLALITVYLGLRDRRAAHRRLARWTFPIWLYVSITGVVVYAMLYHLYPAQ